MPVTEHRTVNTGRFKKRPYTSSMTRSRAGVAQVSSESVKLRVEAFESARDAAQELDALSHGCIVLDVRMPGMSGPELMDHLIERGFAIRLFGDSNPACRPAFPWAVYAHRQALVISLQKLRTVRRFSNA